MASIGRSGNWLNTVWIATATRKPGTNHHGLKSYSLAGLASFALGQLVGDGGEDGERRAVHHRRAEPAHQPTAGAIVGEDGQIEDFSTTEKPAPMAKPEMTASSL